jgi:light-dependent protochlorophyllide reductase
MSSSDTTGTVLGTGLGTVLITGGNRGLGLACARTLAQSHRVILACRDLNAGQQAAETIRQEMPNAQIEALELDLASLASVRDFVQRWRARGIGKLSALICNAGTWRQSNRERSVDGYELTFASNHLGHFLLLHLLLPEFSPDARVLLVSSSLHDPSVWKGGPVVKYINANLAAHPEQDGFQDQSETAAGSRAYATSKLCNLLFTYELARRLKTHREFSGISVNAFNPGLMAGTGLNRGASWFSIFVWKHVLPRLRRVIPGSFSVEASAQTLARLAVDPTHAGITGRYFGTLQEEQSSSASHDPALASELWQSSLELAGISQEARLL